jgi:hypothetical protein
LRAFRKASEYIGYKKFAVEWNYSASTEWSQWIAESFREKKIVGSNQGFRSGDIAEHAFDFGQVQPSRHPQDSQLGWFTFGQGRDMIQRM